MNITLNSDNVTITGFPNSGDRIVVPFTVEPETGVATIKITMEALDDIVEMVKEKLVK